MNLFVSWSGEPSRQLAEIITLWLPEVIQVIRPIYSPIDIDKGARWEERLAELLNETDYGIVCLTPNNLTSDWIHFESGALTKSVENSALFTILFRLRVSDVKGPLQNFNHTLFERAEMFKLATSINKLTTGKPGHLNDARLQKSFDNAWESLDARVATILEGYSEEDLKDPVSDTEEETVIEEVLRLSRETGNRLGSLERDVSRLYRSVDRDRRTPIAFDLPPVLPRTMHVPLVVTSRTSDPKSYPFEVPADFDIDWERSSPQGILETIAGFGGYRFTMPDFDPDSLEIRSDMPDTYYLVARAAPPA